jgi:hypothetical protein
VRHCEACHNEKREELSGCHSEARDAIVVLFFAPTESTKQPTLPTHIQHPQIFIFDFSGRAADLLDAPGLFGRTQFPLATEHTMDVPQEEVGG